MIMKNNRNSNKKKGAFLLRPVQVQNGRKNRLTAFLTDVCFVWLYLAGMTFWLESSLQLDISIGICLLAVLAAALLQQLAAGGWSENGAGRRWLGILSWCGALAVIALAAHQMWLSGIHQICNHAVDMLGHRFPYLFSSYAVTVDTSAARYLAVLWVMLLLALAGGYLVRSGNRILLGMQIVCMLVLQLVTGIGPVQIRSFVPVLCCLIAVWMRGHGEQIAAGRQRLAALQNVIGLAVLAVIVLAAGSLALGKLVPQDGTVLSDWKAAAVEKIRDLRYGGSNEVLPDGSFSGLGSFQPKGDAVLTVTMSQPESYYLRGFIGSDYTGDGWKDTDAVKLWKSRDLFYWLHRDGFYGQETLSDATLIFGSEEDRTQKNNITVKNTSGSSRYYYVPYELDSSADSGVQAALGEQKIGDSTIIADGLRGQRQYTYQALLPQITKYPVYTTALLDTDALDEAGKNYQNLESYYNEFVYHTYLDMPERIQRTLSSLLGEARIPEGEKHVDYSEAKENILYLLTSAYTDSNQLDERWTGDDFIFDFLQISQKGYSVHFASAATMMFRYYGIPARYVEGYLITPEDAQAMTAGEPYVVDDTHAHAWVEYYQDGVGWLPFETTPSYLDIMNKAEDYQNISGVSGGSSQDEQDMEQQEEEKQEEEEPDEKIDWVQVILILLVIGICVLLLVMIAFLMWVLIQRHKSRVLKRKFDDENAGEAVRAMYEYTMNILAAAGLNIRNTSLYRYEKQIAKMFDEETAAEYHRIVDIRQEAVYSSNEITSEQKTEMMAFKETIWKRIYTNGTVIQKLQLKYIYFL